MLEYILGFEKVADEFCDRIQKTKEIKNFLNQHLQLNDETIIYEQNLWEIFQSKYQQYFKIKLSHEKNIFQERIGELFQEKKKKIDQLRALLNKCQSINQ